MTTQEQLARAIQLAATVHLNQVDKSGNPYILHPLHLMHKLLFDLQLATIAVLHDIIEDSIEPISIESLKAEGFSDRVLFAIDVLTHKNQDEYLTVYIKNICTNYDAIRVKRKDLEHNSDITRLKGISAKDLKRIEKYHKAFIILGEAKRNFNQ